MFDEDTTFTERARSWLKEFEPTPEQIQGAFSGMLAKLDKTPTLANDDTEECLNLLKMAYAGVGGSVDAMLAAIDAAKQAQPPTHPVEPGAGLDLGNLYEVNDGPVVELPSEEKRDAFLRLKAQFGGQVKKREAGTECTGCIF